MINMTEDVHECFKCKARRNLVQIVSGLYECENYRNCNIRWYKRQSELSVSLHSDLDKFFM